MSDGLILPPGFKKEKPAFNADWWLDAFYIGMQAACEKNADKDFWRKRVGCDAPGFDLEVYRDWEHAWKEVRAQFKLFGLEDFDDAEIEGVNIDPKTLTLSVAAGKVCFYRPGDKIPMTLKGVPARIAVNFLNFFTAGMRADQDPRAFVRQALSSQGVTAENFHQHADKLMITNPWEE